MYLKSLFSLFVLGSSFAWSQLYIIQDKDGYTNVRKSPNGKIVGKIVNHEVFGCVGEAEIAKWSYVTTKSLRTGKDTDGYMHDSRMKCIEKFPKITVKEKEKEKLILKGRGYAMTGGCKNGFHIKQEGLEKAPAQALTSLTIKHEDKTVEVPLGVFKDILFLKDRIYAFVGPDDVLYVVMDQVLHSDMRPDGGAIGWAILSIKNGKILYGTKANVYP